jgi:hypothetical protein
MMNSEAYDYGSISWVNLTNDEFAEAARRPDVWIEAAARCGSAHIF